MFGVRWVKMPIRITAPNAKEKFTDWIANRGGVFQWLNVNLSGGNDLFTPAKDDAGNDYPKPHWGVDNKPILITDISAFEFVKMVEVKRFRVALRRGAQGLSIKLTDASSRKLRNWLDKFGPNSIYEFDYSVQEAVILIPENEFEELNKTASKKSLFKKTLRKM